VTRAGALIVDFDGTACSVDVGAVLLDRFGRPGWREYDLAVDRGQIGLRQALREQAAMLGGDPEEMVDYAVEHCRLEATFAGFVAWSEERGLPLTIVSDGFAFYIPPILSAAGLERVPVITNEILFDSDGSPPTLTYPSGHPECVGCGTCKMRAVLSARERHGPVAFVGDGLADRYGALYSDVVFAKGHLMTICERDGVPFVPWDTFDDVRSTLESLEETPGALAPERCPGWREP
jgi:2-hydroxy-3-keto-5-methylthiopentenyl-1-phosphate phosphatase